MPGSSEVGAADIKLESYKCSINKITVSTKWKAPDSDVDETVSSTVYDSTSGKGKDIYLVTSPKGKSITITASREAGKCNRKNHKVYDMSWVEYEKDEEGNRSEVDKVKVSSYNRTDSRINVEGLVLAAAVDTLVPPVLSFFLPFHLVTTPLKISNEIQNETKQTIKCFEIGGAFEALKYWNLPVPIDKSYVTTFKHSTCKEGAFQYRIVSYPDISFKLEFSLKSEVDKDSASKNLLKKIFNWCRPTFKVSTVYNGKVDRMELNIDLNKDEKDKDKHEYVNFKYIKNNTVVAELGSNMIEHLPTVVEDAKSFFKAIKKICTHEFIQEFLSYDTSSFKAISVDLVPPCVSVTLEGKYRTSRDLTEIGKYYLATIACSPLIGIKYTIDLLYLILNAVSSGAYTGIYLLVKNLGPILEDLLGTDIKKSPLSAEVVLALEITGKVNASMDIIIDTIKKDKDVKKLSMTPIEGVVDVDLKAKIAASVKVIYFVTAGIEFSASASSGITIKVGLENHMNTGDGLVVPFGILFNGMKVKYAAKANAGLTKTKIKGKTSFGLDVEGTKKIWDVKEIYSHEFVFFKDKPAPTGRRVDQLKGNKPI